MLILLKSKKRKGIVVILTCCMLMACSTETENKVREALGLELVNVEPNAVISGNPTLKERSSLVFDARDSSDSDGTISTYEWTLDTTTFEGSAIQLEIDRDEATLIVSEVASRQTVSLTLTVTDNEGESNSDTLEITIDEIDLARLPTPPADPTDRVLGTDIDDDGVRDDIEREILQIYPLDIKKRELARMAAMIINSTFDVGLNGNDVSATNVADSVAQAIGCFELQEGMEFRDYAFLRALMADTPERLGAFDAFNSRMSGKVFTLKPINPDDCSLPQN